MTSFNLAAFAEDPAASVVLDRLRDGRWRKARDAAKDLCKKDRPRYLPLLVEANAGLVGEMLAKGLCKEAETVLAYLETIASVERVARLRTEMAETVVRTAPGAGKPAAVGGGAAAWTVTLRAARELADGKEVSPADQAAVDQLVADGFVPPADSGDEVAQRVAAELATVRKACDATGDGRWEEAKEALRGLPQRSVFRQWRMFLRGVRCVFEEDLETVRRCFGGLPAGGALALAAGTLDPVPGKPSAPLRARVPLLLAATGQPETWAAPIIAATVAWKGNKRFKAFEELRTGLKGAFPTQRPGLGSALTDAILPFGNRMEEADYDFADEVVNRIARRKAKRAADSAQGVLALLRPLCVAEWRQIPPSELEKSWREVLMLWTDSEGPDPERDSAAWHWLGGMLALPPDDESLDPFGFGAVEKPDFRRARKALEKAVECDPQNEEAWLSLLRVMSLQNDSKAHNGLLVELVKRFPRNKRILVLAGNEALQRKTYSKGLAALEAAHALDPLDKEVKVSMLVARVLQTREQIRKARPVAEQWAAMEPLLEDRPGRAHLMLSRWIARVRQGLLDPDPESAGRARADAARLAPSVPERLFLEESLAAAYKVKSHGSWEESWRRALAGGDLGWGVLSSMLDLLGFAVQVRGRKQENQNCGGARVLESLGVLLDRPDKDPDGLLGFLDHLAALRKDREFPAAYTRDLCLRDLSDALDPLVKNSRSNRKLDPRLRLARLISLELTGSHVFTSRADFCNDLDAVVADATKLGMTAVAARAEAMRKRLNEMYEDDHQQDVFDEDDEFEDPFGEGLMDEDDDRPMPSKAVLVGMLQDYVLAVEAGNQREIAAARECLLALGFPEEVLSRAIEAAEQTRAPAPRPKAKKKPKAKHKRKPSGPPPPSPGQLDLFD